MPAPDLVGAEYPLQYVLNSLGLGLSNASQSNVPPFTNAAIPFLGGLSDGALAASGVAVVVPVPVTEGALISKVTFFSGATASAKLEHQFAALYAGTGAEPALLGQSADGTSTAITAKQEVTYALESGVLITSTNAPNGYVYAAVAIEGETIPTAVSVATAVGVNYKWATNSPLFWSMTAGSSLKGAAAAKVASASAKTVAPLVFLT